MEEVEKSEAGSVLSCSKRPFFKELDYQERLNLGRIVMHTTNIIFINLN